MAHILKPADVGPETEPVIYVFEDVARRRVEQAEHEVCMLLEDARRRADELCRTAEEMGRQAAAQSVEQELIARLAEKTNTLLPALGEAAAQLADARQAWLRRWEQTGIQLAIKIAERIVRREVATSPSVTTRLIREALEMAAGSPRIRLLLHPADREALGDEAHRLSRAIAPAADTQIVSDPSISRGGCRVETQHGVIDQRIETQLDRIAEELSAGT